MDQDGYIDSTLIAYSNAYSYGVERLILGLDDRNQVEYWIKLLRHLDESVEDAQHIRQLLDSFYDNIEKDPRYWSSYDKLFIWTVEEQDLLGNENSYVGAKQCAPCHEKEMEKWQLTKHAGAYMELIKEHRNYYPRCVICHTTGFNYPTGFQISDPSFTLGGVQCEVCHGPGKKHIEWAWQGESRNEQISYIRSILEEKYCTECHDQKNSPEFFSLNIGKKLNIDDRE